MLRRTPLKPSAIKRKAPLKHGGRIKPKRRNGTQLKQDKITGELREICHGDAWQQRREEVWERDEGKCRDCGKPVPLHSEGSRRAAEIHHRRRRGMGGGSRDDRHSNLMTLCWECHDVRTTRGE